VADYRAKVEGGGEEEATMPGGMFGPNSLPTAPEGEEPSPYGDTAILRTDIDLARERPMDSAAFKKQFLSESLAAGGEEKEENPYRRRYLAWVRGEERADGRAARAVTRLDPAKVELPGGAEGGAQRSKEGGQPGGRAAVTPSSAVSNYLEQFERQTLVPRVVQEPGAGAGRADVYEQDPHSQLPFPALGPDTVAIPAQLQDRGYNLFRLGDAFYDQQGQLLYRVPATG
jgi:hypothetical protein